MKKAVVKKEKAKLINLKVNKHDLGAILRLAKKYAGGNVSLWLRHAGMHHKPSKDLA